jgi:hypothetical protein
MPVQKKIPMRRCLGCMESFPKKELIRVVRKPDGEVSLDFRGKVSGRGAYVCRRVDCLKKAEKARRLSRALECEIPDDVMERLRAEMESGDGDE